MKGCNINVPLITPRPISFAETKKQIIFIFNINSSDVSCFKAFPLIAFLKTNLQVFPS